MESVLVDEFIEQTGCDTPDVAYHYLQTNNWNVSSAVQDFRDAVNDGFAESTKKLQRGISRATDNINIVQRARNELAKDNVMKEIPKHTFVLPDLAAHGMDFQNFLEKDLIDMQTMASLENAGRLNWWIQELGVGSKLWPLSTTGDGNCLLHAASLAMWGFHDRLLVLRQALYMFLKGPNSESLKRRWRWQQTKANAQAGFCYAEDEWNNEWQEVVDMASPEKRTDQQSTYKGLEEIHVLALSHVVRRVIIIISDTMLRDSNNEPFAPIPFGGIYIPFDCDPTECHKIPLIFSYDMAHFSALVCMEKESDQVQAVVPLVDAEGNLLPIQFSVDPGPNYNWSTADVSDSNLLTERDQIAYLKKYLDVIDLSGTSSSDIDSEDEIEKRFAEALDIAETTDQSIFNNKNKAAKQLQTLGKQFGSIGKSMSKKLKKNFGSLTKLTTKSKKNENPRLKMLCAEIQLQRNATQMEMIKNYMKFAHHKCLLHYISELPTKTTEEFLLKAQAIREGPIQCATPGCQYYGSLFTCYMCSKCFAAQKREFSKYADESHFGTGKSKFYRESDMNSYQAIKNIPVSRSNLNNDQTLYLSNSTFYNDSNRPFNVNYNNNNEIESAQERLYRAIDKWPIKAVPNNSPVQSLRSESSDVVVQEACEDMPPSVATCGNPDARLETTPNAPRENEDLNKNIVE